MDNSMRLPRGKTCGECKFFSHCQSLFMCAPENVICDFHPIRFVELSTNQNITQITIEEVK